MKKKNIRKDEIIKEGSKVFGEFKDFIARGNVIDLAVGVVIGSAFGKIVTSIVNDILMPIIGIIIGGIDFSGLSLKIGSATVNYGMFIQNVIDFLIVAICIFFFIKIIERLTKKKEIKEEKVEEAKANYSDIDISVVNLAEDAIANRNLSTIFNIFLYGFIVLISLIGIANIFNTISTNINLRRREFANLKSIGMTDKSFRRMLNLECFFYGTKALLYGVPIGVFLCFLINQGFGNMIEFIFTLPWQSILISTIAVYTVVFVTMLYASSKVKKENIIDVLRNDNI